MSRFGISEKDFPLSGALLRHYESHNPHIDYRLMKNVPCHHFPSGFQIPMEIQVQTRSTPPTKLNISFGGFREDFVSLSFNIGTEPGLNSFLPFART